jgi:phage head maturation protease
MAKKRVRVTDDFLGNLPEQLAEGVSDALKESDVEPVLKRVPTVEPVHTGVAGAGSATLYASTRRLDRDNEVIVPEGVNLDQYNLAPVLLFAHQWSATPIGSMQNTHNDGYGIKGVANFASTEKAQDIFTLVKEGHLRTSSIGFIPTEVVDQSNPLFTKLLEFALMNWGEFTKEDARKVERFITRGIMLENSIVPVPANPDALIQAVHGKSLDPDLLRMMGIEETEEKGVVIQNTIWIDSEEQDEVAEIMGCPDEDDKKDAEVEPDPEPESDEKSNEPAKMKTIMRVISRPSKEPEKKMSSEEIAAIAAEKIEIMKGKI